jgi:hypothetical protein
MDQSVDRTEKDALDLAIELAEERIHEESGRSERPTGAHPASFL